VAYVFVHSQVHSGAASGRFVPRRTSKSRLPNGDRFTDAEFDSYRDVWVALQDLRDAGEVLWDHATKANLNRFAQCLKDTQKKIAAGAIFFRDNDYGELHQLLQYFISFYDGKEGLIQYLDHHPDAISPDGRSLDPLVIQQIEENRNNMAHYTNILERLRSAYHDHLGRPTETVS
jgi:hypothetical protein